MNGSSDNSGITCLETSVPRFAPLFKDQQYLKELYLCVLVTGTLPDGQPGYCYFGVFADKFLQFMNRLQIGTPFNPNQFGAIVLARSSGTPTSMIREFMRVRFSFSEENVILEISRSK
ncbi:MAG: hypothetical protein ACOVQM_02360 [Pirellula sp.]|jgi:hypothetical protein